MSSPPFWNVCSSVGRQLILFPFLGGFGASYNTLIGELSPSWDVWCANPPGHGVGTEEPLADVDELVQWYLPELKQILRPGAVIGGHSMGGHVAYRVLCALDEEDWDGPRPTDLLLSASAAPCGIQTDRFSQLPTEALLEHLAGFGALPREVAGDRKLMAAFIPAFRADYRVLDQIRQAPPRPVHVNTCLVLAEEDPMTPPQTVDDWSSYLDGPLTPHTLSGVGHMFVQTDAPLLAEIIENVAAGQAASRPAEFSPMINGTAGGPR